MNKKRRRKLRKAKGDFGILESIRDEMRAIILPNGSLPEVDEAWEQPNVSPQNLSGIGDPVLGTYTDSILDWLVDFGKYSGDNNGTSNCNTLAQ